MRRQLDSAHRLCMLRAGICLASMSGAAFAQAPAAASVYVEGTSPQLEEVVVTAQKREEKLKNVPVPVSVISAASLVQNNQVLLQDYVTAVPALVLTPVLGPEQSLAIRGITTGGQAIPTVAVLVDDIPFGDSTRIYTPNFDPGDISQIEVLRGPQGTLYGANAMGGLVKYNTIQPSNSGLFGSVSAGLSGVESGSKPGYNLRGSINAPLSDSVAVRASAFDRTDPGYIDNILTNKSDVNKVQVSGGRAALRWLASDAFSLTLSALYQHSRQDGSFDVDRNLGDLQQQEIPGAGVVTSSLQAYSATIKAKAGIFDIVSLTAYNDNDTKSQNDLTTRPFRGGTLGGAMQHFYGVGGAFITFPAKSKKFTQEVRASFPIVRSLEATVGAYYTHEKIDDRSYFQAVNIQTGAIAQDQVRYHDPLSTYTEYAAFGNLDYQITNQFDVQLGIRTSHINNVFEPYLQWPGFSSPLPPSSTPCDSTCTVPGVTAKASPVNYLVTPRYKISDDAMVYLRFATGYRPGGVNVGVPPGIPTQYNPDQTKNYELGVKADFLDHKVSLDASLYHIIWSNIQVQLQVLDLTSPNYGQLYQGNGGSAKSDGFEVSATVKPVTGMILSGWFAYNIAELTQDFNAGTHGLSGDRLPYATKISGHLSAEQRFPIRAHVTGIVGADASYVGDRLGIFQSPNPDGTIPARPDYPSYTTFDLHAGLDFVTWSANIYANNVFDKRGLLGDSPFQPNALFYIKPRNYGINVSKSF